MGHLVHSEAFLVIERMTGIMVQFSPRYDGTPVIDLSSVVADPATAFIRQRRRLAGTLSDLSAQEWATPSRCEGWSVQDVGEHLASVNRFWLFSLQAGLRGEPTQLLLTFDPVKVPAQMVEDARGAAPAETLERLVASNDELADLLTSLSGSDWTKVAEAPPGHLALSAVCAHALWDAWIHERDVLVPLGRPQQAEPDEVFIALVYVAALGPAFYVNAGQVRSGSLAIRAHEPDATFVVDVSPHQVTVRQGAGAAAAATVTVQGKAGELLDALSCRSPLPQVTEDERWLVDGLRRAFDPSG